MKIINKIKNILSTEENDSKIIVKYLFILGLIGVVLLMGENLFITNNNNNNRGSDSEVKLDSEEMEEDNGYLDKLSHDLEELISSTRGIGKVKVQIYPSSNLEYEYEYNTDKNNKVTNETDQNDGERRIEEEDIDKEMVILTDDNGNEKPVKSVENKPEIESVLIVAEGVENSEIKYEIYQAVSNFLNLSFHKINVLPYERR